MMQYLKLPLVFRTEKGDILIDFMAIADLASAHDLEVKTFKSPASLNSFKNLIENPDTINLIAKNEMEHVAYLTSQRVLDEVHIFNMAVIPDYRRLGIAERLLDILFGIAQGNGEKKVYLEVRVTNTPAISLYQKVGFSRLGIRKSYYHDNNEDAMVMVKYL